jgi:hypothetical protein
MVKVISRFSTWLAPLDLRMMEVQGGYPTCLAGAIPAIHQATREEMAGAIELQITNAWSGRTTAAKIVVESSYRWRGSRARHILRPL